MDLKIVNLCILVLQINGQLEPPRDELPSSLSLTQCIVGASNKYFQQNELMVMSLTTRDPAHMKQGTSMNEVLLAGLYQQNKWSFLLRQPNRMPPYRVFIKKTDVYIILVKEEGELHMHLEKLQRYMSWNPHADLMVISDSMFANNRLSAARMVIVLNYYKIYKAVVVLPMNSDPTTYEVFTWNPFSAENCGEKLHKIKIIDRCRNGVFKTKIDWFAGKIPNNLNGCKIKVMTVVWPPYVMAPERKIPGTVDEYEFLEGIEVKTINTIAEVANLTVVYRKSDIEQNFGYIRMNGSCAGLFCELKAETIDIAMCSLAATQERHIFFDAISSLLLESLKFCVPHALREAQWRNVISVLKVEVWLFSSFIMAVMTLIIYGFTRLYQDESTSYKTVPSIWQNLTSVLLGITVPRLPRSNIIRFLMITWIFFGLHLNTAYQTNLVGILTSPNYEPQIDSVDGLVKSNLKMYFLPNSERYFRYHVSSAMNVLLARWTDCNNIKTCLGEVAFQRTAIVCAPMNYIDYSMNRYTAKNGESLIYCFKRAVATYPTEMYTRKGFPLRDRIGKIISRIAAAGLPAMWLKNLYKNKMKTQGHEVESLGTDGHVMISINHMQAVFFSYLISMGFACILFIAELYVFKRSQAKKTQSKTQFYNK